MLVSEYLRLNCSGLLLNKLTQSAQIHDFLRKGKGTIAVKSLGIFVVLHQQGVLLLTIQLFMLWQKGHAVGSTWFCIAIYLKLNVIPKSLQSFLVYLKHHIQFIIEHQHQEHRENNGA